MKINDLIRRSWQVADDKGWHDRPRSDRTYETLFHSEVSEYAEEVRGNKDAVYDNWSKALDAEGRAPQSYYDHHGNIETNLEGFLPKPEGLAVELVDLMIRWGDYLGEKKVVDGPHGDHEDHGTEQMAADFAALADKGALIAQLALDEPMEYAALLHRHISSIFENFEAGDVEMASYELGSLSPMVLVMFAHKGWDFDAVFERKMAYNARRPYRHGGKAV